MLWGFIGLFLVLGALMSNGGVNIMSECLKTAQSQIGTCEDPPGSNADPGGSIAEYLRAGCWNRGPAPWCAAFVSWCYAQNGIFPNTASAADLRTFAIDFGAWIPHDGSQNIPSGVVPGSYFVMDSHAGIVQSIRSDGGIDTVEGNTGDCVQVVSRVSSCSRIKGFATFTKKTGSSCNG